MIFCKVSPIAKSGLSSPIKDLIDLTLSELWLSFAADPSKPPSLGHGMNKQDWSWPKYDPDTDSMLRFGSSGDLVEEVPGSIIDANCTAMGLL